MCGGVLCSNMDVDMTPDVAMETGRARCCLWATAAAAPERSFTPLESVLMTLVGREAEASDPSRLIPEDLAAGGALRCLDGFSKATPAPTVVARLATGLEGLGAAMDGLGVVESLLRCESDRLIRARLSLFLRNSLEGIVTGDCGDLALCVEGEDDLEALAACSSVDLGVANKSSLDVETALLPAVLRCGLRGGCCDL